MAILAAAYAVCQPESLPRPGLPSTDALRPLLNAEPMDKPIVADETARALDFLLDTSFRTRFAGNAGAEAGMSPDDLDLRRKRMR